MFGICLLPLVPLREQPTSKSEMVSQLLFGEQYKVLHQQADWIKVETINDQYIGWISEGQADFIEEAALNELEKPIFTTSFPHQLIKANGLNMFVTFGSKIYNKRVFTINNQKFELDYQEADNCNLLDTAMQFLNTAYLWGGRTPWGIDCSGYTQQVFAQQGVFMKRDAYQQAEMGQALAFLSEAQLGDLAFFDNNEGKITHVGILLDNETIIHASGKVRIDKIDNHGIIHSQTKKYTHKLRFLKRIL